MTCRKCGSELPTRTGRGRSPTYCSSGCRRATEYELRRLQKALELVEEQARWCRFGWHGRRPTEAAKYDAERVRLEDRLRELLDDPETVTPA